MPLTKIEDFSVSHLQVLDEQGRLDEELDPKLSDEDLLRLYRAMILAREADQRMLKLQRQGRIGTFAPSTGQEAAACGSAFALNEKDWAVFAFRELGAVLLRGCPLSRILLYYNGYEEGSVFPSMERNTPVSIIVGSQALHAVGIAYGMQYRGENETAVISYFGDGATSQGDFHEALNFAGVWKVPVVFLCQNNQWAISISRKKQTEARTLAQKAIAHGIPGVQVDGNDALAVYRATNEALDRARAGQGPTFIEAVTYRLMMHTTADDPTKYRPEEEVETAWKQEPLVRFKLFLEGRGILDEAKQAGLESEVKKEIDVEVKAFESAKGFKPDAPFDHVFGTRHEIIEEQRAEFLSNLSKESADG